MHPTLEKAQKLLTLAADERGNEHERRNAALALVKLMVEHKMTLTMPGAAPPPTVTYSSTSSSSARAKAAPTRPPEPPKVPSKDECGWARLPDETFGVWCRYELAAGRVIPVTNVAGKTSLVRIEKFVHRSTRRGFPAWIYVVERL